MLAIESFDRQVVTGGQSSGRQSSGNVKHADGQDTAGGCPWRGFGMSP